MGSQRQVTDVEDFERVAGLTPTMRKKLPPSFTQHVAPVSSRVSKTRRANTSAPRFGHAHVDDASARQPVRDELDAASMALP